MRSRRLAVDDGSWLYHVIFSIDPVIGSTPTADHGPADFITLDMSGGGDDPQYSNAGPIAPSFLTVWAGGIVSTEAVTTARRIFMGLDARNLDLGAFPGTFYNLGRVDPSLVDEITIGAKYEIVGGLPSTRFEVVLNSFTDFNSFASLTILNGVESINQGSILRPADALTTFGDDTANVIAASAQSQTVFGLGGNDTLTTGAAQTDLHGGDNNDTLTDTFGKSNLYGESGNDTINAGQGSYVSGGEGDDSIRPFIEADDSQVATGFALLIGYVDGGSGIDRAVFDLRTDTRNLQFTVANEFDSYLGAYFVVGERLALVNVEAVEIRGGSGNDTLTTAAGNDVLIGGAGADTLNGGAGNDYIDGSSGGLPAGQHDVLIGGSGNDFVVVDDLSDEVIEDPGTAGGIDTVRSWITYTLPANVENLTLIGTAAINATGSESANKLFGNDAANTLTGLGGADILDGGKGADTMIGGSGDDTYYIDNIGDTAVEFAGGGTDTVYSTITFSLEGTALNVLRLSGAAAINGTGSTGPNEIYGNDAVNTLTGLDGKDTLNGGKGADTLIGGPGDDTYYVDNTGDKIIELSLEGVDTVYSSVNFTFGAAALNILRLTGTAPLSGTGNNGTNDLYGNSGANLLTGLAGVDRLDGGAGVDTMVGGADDDTYYVDNIGDKVIELAGEGTDRVFSSVNYDLGSTAAEALYLTGTATINAKGNDLNNTLVGNAAANVINGLAGADRMVGGLGDDTYTVDNTGDRVVEKIGGGTDMIFSTVTFTLTETYVETLRLIGSAVINATGNNQANTLIGNGAVNTLTGLDGADTLDGNVGADTLIGGRGDDSYVVDNIGDKVIEIAGEGNDTVQSSVTFSLAGMSVETLKLTGVAAIGATGNDDANTLVGNEAANTLTGLLGNDTLDGALGADTMLGGQGDDTYFVDNSADKATEVNGEGNDTIFSTATFTLGGTFVETLVLTGGAAINGSGNSQNNTLIGNGMANLLRGFGGIDTLDGGLGADTLTGDDGADTFRFSVDPAGGGADTITDFVSATDKIALASVAFNEMAAGALSAGAFVAGTTALDADDRILYDAATGQIWFDADGSNEEAAVLFAKLAPGTALVAADFIVI